MILILGHKGLIRINQYHVVLINTNSGVKTVLKKLAVIIWNMIAKKLPYKPHTEYLFLYQKRKRKVLDYEKANKNAKSVLTVAFTFCVTLAYGQILLTTTITN